VFLRRFIRTSSFPPFMGLSRIQSSSVKGIVYRVFFFFPVLPARLYRVLHVAVGAASWHPLTHSHTWGCVPKYLGIDLSLILFPKVPSSRRVHADTGGASQLQQSIDFGVASLSFPPPSPLWCCRSHSERPLINLKSMW